MVLNREMIRELLVEVAEELEGSTAPHSIVVVGGALLAWHDLRGTTVDVDTVAGLDDELRHAAAEVAVRHGLAPAWLNDSAAPFLPSTFELSRCELLLDLPTLRVLGAPVDQVFLMKLYAARARDTEDLEALWPQCSFADAAAAAAEFYEAYPLETFDPHLEDFIRIHIA